MVCDGSGSQNISVGSVHLSTTSGFTYNTGDQALTSVATNFDLSISQRTDDITALTKDSYLILRMPSTGVSGTCINTVTFTAKANA